VEQSAKKARELKFRQPDYLFISDLKRVMHSVLLLPLKLEIRLLSTISVYFIVMKLFIDYLRVR
jgi:hypothetical protein